MKLIEELDELREESSVCSQNAAAEDVYLNAPESAVTIAEFRSWPKDALYFAALHNAYPELKARIEELEKENANLRALERSRDSGLPGLDAYK